ncbi:MAG: DUF1961 family protein [Opitutales bacterium]
MTTPDPRFRYLQPDQPDAGLTVDGPFSVREHDGRSGLLAGSVRSRLSFPEHTVAGDQGALTWWLLPLEGIAPAHQMRQFPEFEPDYFMYGLMGDHPDLRDRSQMKFHLRYTTDWWRNLTASFHRDPQIGYNAIIAPDHFKWQANVWHQLALTWNKPENRYRLYVNSVLVATENKYHPMPYETAGDTLYAGNPSFALGELAFFDQELDAETVAGRFAAQATGPETDLAAHLHAEYVGDALPAWQPDLEGLGEPTEDLSLTDPAQMDRFVVQGQDDGHRITDEGLVVDTSGGDSRKDGLHFNKVENYLWLDRCFEGDLAVDFEFKVNKRNGLALILIHGSGMQREDFMADYPMREDGSMKMVCWENVRSYHWEFYRETDNTRNDTETHLLVKNPWMVGLAHQCGPEPLALDTWHRLTLVQAGARIRGAINGCLLFDVTDDPYRNHGPVYHFGRFALRCKFKTAMVFRNLRIWER